jgi:hypothetical protein
MMDTMGQAAALTGGYGNSYASTAGNQAYQAYLQKLNDVVPDLYKLALDKYNQEGQDMKDLYGMYANEYGREYGEYRDQVGDWQDQADRLQNAYYNERDFDYSAFADNRDYQNNYYNNERNFDYGQYSDAYARAFANYQQQVAEQQYWASYNQRAAQYEQQNGAIHPTNTPKVASYATQYIKPPNMWRDNGGNMNGHHYNSYEDYVMSVIEGSDLDDNELAYLIPWLEDRYHIQL